MRKAKMTASNEQAAHKLLEERWMTQKEVQDYRNWLIGQVLALQSQLESTQKELSRLKDILKAVTNDLLGSGWFSNRELRETVGDALASIPGSKKDK